MKKIFDIRHWIFDIGRCGVCSIGVFILLLQYNAGYAQNDYDTTDNKSNIQYSKSNIIKGAADKKQYMIGDPIKYDFSVPLNNKTLNFSSDFQFSDTLQLINSTTDTADNKINYHYVFAGFIEGTIKLPEFQFYEADKTTPLYNVVSPAVDITMPVIDTTTIEVKPLKGLMKIPFTLKEILPFSLGGLVLAGIIIAIIYFIRHKDRRPKILQPKPEIVIPEDEEALSNLTRLKQARLLETGQEKQHYIALSEILWQYIYRRYDVNAFEMTTGQIMENLDSKDISYDNKNKLNNIFTTSDLVKFAKYIPDTRTNLSLLQDSEDFIKDTKRIVTEDGNKTASEENNTTFEENNTALDKNETSSEEKEVTNE
ncbi:MAG: hypothetical protein J6P44_03025 [Bacteroidales bacterium]|nr:hypothetical protein [Bacteroidales bacterium]